MNLTFDSIFDAGFYNDTSADFSATTPAISLTRNLEEGMVYGTIAQGFLSGSFNDELNTTLAPELTPLLTYQPEHVTNYEVGYKGALADGRVRMAVALFWMDYDGQAAVRSASTTPTDATAATPQIGRSPPTRRPWTSGVSNWSFARPPGTADLFPSISAAWTPSMGSSTCPQAMRSTWGM